MQTLWQDVRYGVRMLLKQPGFTLICIAALALSIGANTAIFSAANALLLRPLPVEDIDRFVVPVTLREGFDPFGSPFLEYAAYRDRAHCLASSGVATARSFNLTGRGEPERVRGATVMANYLSTLGTKPVLGRTFSADGDGLGGPPVALISYGLWQKHFGSNADVIRQSLNLDGRSYNVIGVMPPGFDVPGIADVWVPLQVNIDTLPLIERAATNNTIVARLRPGVSLGQADAELKAITRQLEQEYPDFRRGWTVKVVSLRQDLLGDLEGRVHKALFALMAGVAFGLLPALKGAGAHELMPRIKQGDQRSGGDVAGRRWLNGLIVAEIAIALTLLICGGLMVQSFQRLQHVALGFSPDNLLTMKMVLPVSRYSEYRQRIAFADEVVERTRNLAGVVSAGTTTNIPLERETAYDAIFDVEGRPSPNPNDVPITAHRIVSPGYLETLGITLIRGRLINQNDRANSLPIVVVSEEFARQAWPGKDPLGKRVRRIRAGQIFPWMTVVGVVKDVKEDLFNYRINRPVWYVPYAQVENNFPLNLVVRTRIDPRSLIAALRDVVRTADPDQPVSNVMTMNTVLNNVLVTERFGAVLMGTLAISGLILASIGLYGVMAYAVKQRTGEIGLRIALGAQRKHVLALFMGEGMKLTFLGVIIGLIAAWAATRLLVSLLFGLGATDAATFCAISVLLGLVGLIACYFPARRALSVDPIIVLRAE